MNATRRSDESLNPRLRLHLDDHPHQFGQRVGFHLFQDFVAASLDGAQADEQFVGDHLVELAGDHAMPDFVLFRRERRQAAFDVLLERPCGSLNRVPFQSLVDRLHELIVAARLFEQRDRSRFHRSDGVRGVGIGRNQNRRQRRFALLQLFKQIQTAHPQHSQVGHQQPGCSGL